MGLGEVSSVDFAIPDLVFPECIAKGSRYFGGLGVGTCSLDAAFVFATVGNRRQPLATVRDEVAMAMPTGSVAKVVALEVSNVA